MVDTSPNLVAPIGPRPLNNTRRRGVDEGGQLPGDSPCVSVHLMIAGAVLLAATVSSHAQSAYDYPWCAIYPNRSRRPGLLLRELRAMHGHDARHRRHLHRKSLLPGPARGAARAPLLSAIHQKERVDEETHARRRHMKRRRGRRALAASPHPRAAPPILSVVPDHLRQERLDRLPLHEPLEQCMMSAGGNVGFCAQNPAAPTAARRQPSRTHARPRLASIILAMALPVR